MQQVANILIAALMAVAVVFAPVAAHAQSAQPETQSASKPESGGELFDQEHRQRIYEAKKLSHGKAAAWGLVPGFGNFYVDQYLFGALAITSMVFAGFFVGYGVTTDQSDLLWTGLGLAGVTYIWSIGAALLGVNAYNEELRKGLHLDSESAARQTGLRLSISW